MPTPLRVSATQLESFRLFREPDQEWMTEDALLASIRGERVTSPEIRMGAALDEVVQDPARYHIDRPDGYLWRHAEGDHFFSTATLAPVLALFTAPGVWQVKAEERYGDVVVVAKADRITGVEVVENKTTTSTFSFDKYAESAQWRVMADIFRPRRVTYHVFALTPFGDGSIEVRDIHSFALYPYAALHAEVAALVSDFHAYVRARGLDGVLRERQVRAEGVGAL